VALEVDRADPENRIFKHTDPVGWTEAHRGNILRALYIILMGNPMLKPKASTHDETRYHAWWRLVGSAVEHAARQHVVQDAEAISAMAMDADAPCPAKEVSFKDLFLAQEEEEEESASLADVLAAMRTQWADAYGDRKAGNFGAADVASLVNDQSDSISNEAKERRETMREYLFPQAQPNHTVTGKAVAKRLKKRLDEPVRNGDETLSLKAGTDSHTKLSVYFIKAVTMKTDGQ
jgi:hypothetical protein